MLVQRKIQLLDQLQQLPGVLFIAHCLGQSFPVMTIHFSHACPPGRLEQRFTAVGLPKCRACIFCGLQKEMSPRFRSIAQFVPTRFSVGMHLRTASWPALRPYQGAFFRDLALPTISAPEPWFVFTP